MTKMSRSLEFYYVPYPKRTDRNIQSLIWAKREFRECASGPRVTQDKRVSEKYYNMQVFFQRYLVVYKSVLLYFEPGSGKTGAYKCFQEYVNTYTSNHSTFYYFAGRAQINDFQEQVSLQFGNEPTRAVFEKASEEKHVKTIRNKQGTILKNSMKAERYNMNTYGEFRKMVDLMDNDEVIRTFRNAAIFIDEVQFIKLDEDKDAASDRPRPTKKSKKKEDETEQEKEERKGRNRVEVYNAFYRVARLCPDCTYVISTGTPITNSVNDLIYQINLLPGTKLIRTPVSEKIAEKMWRVHGIPPPTEWWKINLLNEDQDELEKNLEEILRGRVMYARAPETDAVKSFLTDDVISKLGDRFPFIDDEGYDYMYWRTIALNESAGRILSTYYMSPFQSAAYIKVHDDSNNIYSDARQSSIFLFPTEEYAKIALRDGIDVANKRIDGNKIAGIIGSSGFELCVNSKDVELKEATGTKSYTQRGKRYVTTYKATPWFAKYVLNPEMVKNSGIKIYEIVKHALNPNIGPICVASTLVFLTCVLIGVILKVHDAEEYNPEIKNLYRKGSLDSTKKRLRYALLATWNKNSHQEILRLAGHPDNVTGEYLKCVLITPVSSVGLNIRGMWEIFIIDPPFTPAQLDQSEKRSLRPNSHFNSSKWAEEHWGTSEFPVYVYYMIAEPDEVYVKRYNEGRVESKQYQGGREWSIYASMHYKDLENARVIHALKRIAIDAQANRGRNIRDSVVPYSPEADYLPREYEPYKCDTSLPIDTSTYDSYYAARDLNIPKDKIHDYFMSLKGHSSATIHDMVEAFQDKYTEVELAIYLKGIVEEQIVPGVDAFGFDVTLNENTDVFYLSRELTRVSDRSLEYYSNFVAVRLSRPLESVVMNFLDEDMIGYFIYEIERSKSYKDYISKNIPNIYKSKLLEDAFVELYRTSAVPDLPLWMDRVLIALHKLHIQLNTPAGQVVVHQVNSLYNGTGSGTNFNPVDSVLKASQQLRIMNVYHGLVWNDCTELEAVKYSEELNNRFSEELDEMYQYHKDLGCIGILVRYDAIHIRRFDVSGDVVESRGTGKNSQGFKLKSLLPLMYRACSDRPISGRREGKNTSRLVEEVYSMMKSLGGNEPTAREVLSTLSSEELKYYISVVTRVTEEEDYVASRELCKCLLKRDAIYTVIGDPVKTIPRIGE